MVVHPQFLGQIARVHSEKAQIGNPAQAILRDEHGDEHFIAIEPEMGELQQGDCVLLVIDKTDYYVVRKIPALHGLF